jgi:hypothetical protein
VTLTFAELQESAGEHHGLAAAAAAAEQQPAGSGGKRVSRFVGINPLMSLPKPGFGGKKKKNSKFHVFNTDAMTEAAAPPPPEEPLPPPEEHLAAESTWQEVHGETGTYWWNENTGATSWDPPAAAAPAAPQLQPTVRGKDLSGSGGRKTTAMAIGFKQQAAHF